MSKAPPDEVNLNLKEFQMEWVGDNKILVFIGKRNTGKSVLVIDYLYYNDDIPFCTCIAPTDSFNDTFRPHIPSKFIFDTYTPELIETFLKRQQKMCKRKKLAEKGIGDIRYKEVDPRGLLIMDDCLADAKDWSNDKNIKWIFMNGRHAKITLILTMQYQIGIPPAMRVNVDYVFICKETKRTERDKLWKYYAGMFPSLDMFIQIHTQVTKDYGCMVVDNTSQSDKLIDQVYYYKALLREPGSFRVCYEEFWVDNDDYIRKDCDSDDGTGPGKPMDDYQNYTGARSKFKYNLNIVPTGQIEESPAQGGTYLQNQGQGGWNTGAGGGTGWNNGGGTGGWNYGR